MIPHLKTKPLSTENLNKGETVYGEELFYSKKSEWRTWNPKRSKLGAALLKKMTPHITDSSLILYLGASSGTTCSHLSDIVRKGMIFGVEFAPRMAREFVLLSERRPNLTPIVANAAKPEEYRGLVPQVDFLYQDVAQPNQTDIFLKNADLFLKKGGQAFLMVKSRSIDVTKNPKEVFKKVISELSPKLKILDKRRLEPYERDHMAILCKKE